MKKILLIITIIFSIFSCKHETFYEGYVKDAETGDPLTNVKIELFAQDKEELIREGKATPICTESDSNRYYRIKITDFNKAIRILYSYYIYQYVLKDTIICDSARENTKVPDILMTIDSKNSALYRGNIKDANTLKPISGVQIIQYPVMYTQTNKNGNYIIKFIHKDTAEVNLSFEKAGYVTHKKKITVIPQEKGVIPEILMKKEK